METTIIHPMDIWARENLPGYVQRDKENFQNLANDKTSASWGCSCPIIDGYQIAWICLSPQHKGDIQYTFYDFVKVED